LNFSATVVTCDGFVQHLSCDTGVISVQSATYGRTSSQICSFGRPQSQISNTWCSINVPVIYKRCDGLRTCGLNTQGLSTPDPCFGTYKVCQNPQNCIIRLLFFHGTVIHIHSANYGRTDSSTCSTGRPPAQLAKTDCYSLNSHTTVASRCEGKRSCSILASNSVFSDPCFGTFKYLYISYSCVSKCKCYCT
uniref:L-rhamnose-binding lectin CSL3-like n=1 Tax=Sinocyclocheilus grahami TaxID=75366 RepID=A0A672MZJ5_SINGR